MKKNTMFLMMGLLLLLIGCTNNQMGSELPQAGTDKVNGAGTMLAGQSNFGAVYQGNLDDITEIVIRDGDDAKVLSKDESNRFIDELRRAFIMHTAYNDTLSAKVIEVKANDKLLFNLKGYQDDTLFVLTDQNQMQIHIGSAYIAKLLK